MQQVRTHWFTTAALAGAALLAGRSLAQDSRPNPVQDATRTAQEAGRQAQEAARDAGRAIRDTTQETGRAARDAAQEVGQATRETVRPTARVTADGTDVATGTRLSGTVTRIDPEQNQFVIRTAEGRAVNVYADPQTTYRLGANNATLQTLREGTRINVAYGMRGDRHYASSVWLSDGDANTTVTRTTERTSRYSDAEGGMHFRGKIAQLYVNPDQFVLKTNDGREVTVFIDPREDVSVSVQNRNGRYYLDSFQANSVRSEFENRDGPTPATTTTTTTGTTLEGTIIRVQGTDNQFVLRTQDGREISFYSEPNAVIRYDNRVVPFTEVREGWPATVTYEARGPRNIVRSIIGRRNR